MPGLSSLAEFDAGQFESWLNERLRDLYGPDMSRKVRAVSLVEFGIRDFDSFIEGLEILHGKLGKLPSPRAQESFSTAAGNLLRHASPGDFPAEGMMDLIALIALTHNHSQLEAFNVVLGSGEWGELHPELFRHALSALKTLRSGEEAYETTKSLLTSRNFPDVFLFDAYEILIAGRPARWADELLEISHCLQKLEARLSRSGNVQETSTYQRRFKGTVSEIMRRVPLTQLGEGIQKLGRQIDTLDPDHPVGKALDLFITGLQPPRVVIERDEDGLLLRLLKTGAVFPLTDPSSTLECYFDRLLVTVPLQPQIQSFVEGLEKANADPRTQEQARFNLEQICAPAPTPGDSSGE